MIIVTLFIFAIAIVVTFGVVRLSISLIFWSVNPSKDKQEVFRVYFPYYIIMLVGFAAYMIYISNSITIAIYFGTVYITALLIWRHELKSNRKKKKTFAVEPNPSQLP